MRIIIFKSKTSSTAYYYTQIQSKRKGDFMNSKKSDTRFTIQFNRDNPLHLQVVDILNQQNQRGKARFIVDAVLHYVNCDATPDANFSARLDEKSIEAIVNRVLKERQESGMATPPVSVPVVEVESQPDQSSLHTEDVDFDDVTEALGEEGIKAVIDALDMFKRK